MPDLESSHMDRLTQAANSIDELVRIMYSTLSYLTRKASFKQVNPDFPVTQSIPNSEPPEVFQANQHELVSDFLRKAKQLEYLISVLPTTPPEDLSQHGADDKDFAELEVELQKVNTDYLDALALAETLHQRISTNLTEVLNARTVAPPAPPLLPST